MEFCYFHRAQLLMFCYLMFFHEYIFKFRYVMCFVSGQPLATSVAPVSSLPLCFVAFDDLITDVDPFHA